MKLKIAALGLLASAVCALPVLAHGSSIHGNGSVNVHHVSGPLLGTPVCYSFDDDFNINGDFAVWQSVGGHGSSNNGFQFVFGTPSYRNDGYEGLRIDANNQKCRSWQVDWDLRSSANPYISEFINDPTNGPEDWFDFYSAPTSSSGAFTVTTLKNGFTRINYNAQSDSIATNATWSGIYFFEYNDYQASSDTLRNVLLNNTPVTPNLLTTPAFDYTLYFD
jgi:hypothetical protein